MIKQKRLTRIETSLTPKQAVLLWLRQEHQGRTSREYLRYTLQQPSSARPRTRVETQVINAIRPAMKGQEAGRIHQAVRQAQMYADFLILLVSRTNSVILDDSRCRWLQIALLYEQLRNAALSNDNAKALNKWTGRLRELVTDVCAIQAASELIRDRFFDGECILFSDAIEDLEQQAKIVQTLMRSHDRVVIEAGQPEFATDSDKLQKTVNQLASQRADYIVALAKSKTLDDFDEEEAADAILKPYILEGE
jgi:hypothetical protein